jgi:hypothetical protein
MTIEEMKALKVGDIVRDVKRTKENEREIHCEVESLDEHSVTLIAIFVKDAACYPHRFFFRRDAEALEKV